MTDPHASKLEKIEWFLLGLGVAIALAIFIAALAR